MEAVAKGPWASRDLADAQGELEALNFAERELERRNEDDERSHAEAHLSRLRAATYRWYAAYLTKAEKVLRGSRPVAWCRRTSDGT